MRVLHIGKYYPPFAGGIEHFLADLLPALGKQGVRTAALVHQHPGSNLPAVTPETPSAPAVYRVPCFGRLLYAPISPTFPRWLAWAIREFQPTLLHLHVPNTSAFWALPSAPARRLPWVIHWHADVVPSEIDRRLALAYRAYRPLERRLLAAARVVIATSPAYLDTSRTLQPWRDKCRVIPLGLDPERLADPPAQALVPAQSLWHDAPLRVLAIGRLTYYKGHEVLLKALAAVPEAHLVLVGEGDFRTRLETLRRELNLGARVTLAGFQSEPALHALLATCDVLCLPSLERTEAFGVVLLEAMRFGKPVIASDIPGSGAGWVVHRGGHGLTVALGSPEALAAALRQLAAAPERRAALGRRGTQALETVFHIRRVAEQMTQLYRALHPPHGPESANKTAAPAPSAKTGG